MRYWKHSCGKVEACEEPPNDITEQWHSAYDDKIFAQLESDTPATEITKEEYEKRQLMTALQ